MDETYLGDGLYGAFDGFQIILRAPRKDGDHWIGLEPETLAAVIQLAHTINKKYHTKHFLIPQQNDDA